MIRGNQPTEQSLYDQGGGYVGTPPRDQSQEVKSTPVPATVVEVLNWQVQPEDGAIVFTGTAVGRFLIPEANGTGRIITVIHAGNTTADLTLVAPGWNYIDGGDSVTVQPRSAVTLIDRNRLNWGTVSYGDLPALYYGVSDVNYTIVGKNGHNLSVTALTAARTTTLPPASTAGQKVTISNPDGSISQTNYLEVSRAGSDTINGLTLVRLYVPYSQVTLTSSGAGSWSIDTMTPQVYTHSASGTTSFAQVPGNFLDIDLYGSGASGGGGPLGGVSSQGADGGGAGGRATRKSLRLVELTFPLQVVVGAGGALKAGSAGSSPVAGNNGALSKVTDNNGSGNLLCQAAGGSGANGGASGFGDTFIAGGDGGSGGKLAFAYVGQPGACSTLAAGGGGGGGGQTATPTPQAGAEGGAAGTTSSTGGGGTAGVVGGAATNGGDGGTNPGAGGDGGGGGAAGDTTAHYSGDGGDGAWPGGGGGGGGCALTGYGESTGGDGGPGANGAVILSWRF